MGRNDKLLPFVAPTGKRWRCWIPDSTRPAGRQWISGFLSQKDAHEYAVEFRERIVELGEISDLPTLKEAFDLFIAGREGSVEPKTIKFYKDHLAPFCAYLGESTLLERLSRKDIQRFYKYREGLKSVTKPWTTVRADHRAVRAFIRWCDQEGLFQERCAPNVSGFRFPKKPHDADANQPRIRAAEVFDVVRRIRAAKHPGPISKRVPDNEFMAQLSLLLFFSGMRASGAGNARVKDVDLDGKRQLLTIDKGMPRCVRLEDPVLRDAVRWFLDRADGEFLVGLTNSQISRAFSSWQDIIGLASLQAHAFKRGFTEWHDAKGYGGKDLAAITGHSTPSQAFSYSSSQEALVRRAVGSMSEEIRDLDD